MKQIHIRAARHICAVPGCRCTETFKVTGSENAIGGVFLCADCIAALAQLLFKPKKRRKRT